MAMKQLIKYLIWISLFALLLIALFGMMKRIGVI